MLTLWWGWKFCRWQAVGPSPQSQVPALVCVCVNWSFSEQQTDVPVMFTFTSCIKDVHPHMNVWVCYAWRINVFVEGCVFIYFFYFLQTEAFECLQRLKLPTFTHCEWNDANSRELVCEKRTVDGVAGLLWSGLTGFDSFCLREAACDANEGPGWLLRLL